MGGWTDDAGYCSACSGICQFYPSSCELRQNRPKAVKRLHVSWADLVQSMGQLQLEALGRDWMSCMRGTRQVWRSQDWSICTQQETSIWRRGAGGGVIILGELPTGLQWCEQLQ